jgi:POT family proton-dependent oligopeptide transporter
VSSKSLQSLEKPSLYSVFSTQPKGLVILFFTEMWERFSFYGMRALLILYMTRYMMMQDHTAYGVYGAYGAFVWASPIIGGYLADHFFGQRLAIYVGGLIIAMGHFVLALPMENSLFTGLACLVIGTGLFKPNISSILGQLYEVHDPRRDGGFTIFYMGINLGGFLAPLGCGYVGEVYGWHYGFGLAGVGMLAGLFILLWGQRYLGKAGLHIINEKSRPSLARYRTVIQGLLVLGALALIPVLSSLLQHNEGVTKTIPIFGVVALLMIVFLALQQSVENRKRMLTVLLMLPFFLGYFACLEQTGGALSLFAERNIDRMIGGFEMPASWSQLFNPAFIMSLGAVFAGLWTYLGSRKQEPSVMIKFALGMLATALGFVMLKMGISFAAPDATVNLMWLVLCYFFVTMGELMISPVALSAVTKIAPPQFTSLMMGALFLSQAFSHIVAAGVPKFFSQQTEANLATDKIASLAVFGQTFDFTIYFALFFAVLGFVLHPLTKRVFARYS